MHERVNRELIQWERYNIKPLSFDNSLHRIDFGIPTIRNRFSIQIIFGILKMKNNLFGRH